MSSLATPAPNEAKFLDGMRDIFVDPGTVVGCLACCFGFVVSTTAAFFWLVELVVFAVLCIILTLLLLLLEVELLFPVVDPIVGLLVLQGKL